jgi:hypothetical protein
MANNYYSLPIKIRQTATTGSGATIFSMRNGTSSTVTIIIERMEFLLAFDSGTPVTRSTQSYDLVRFSTATPTGGTALSVAQMYSGDAGTQITDARWLDTGLTTTGVVFNSPFCTISCPASDGATTKFHRDGVALWLGVGEGFCIKLNGAAVVGQSISGEVVWSER